LGQLRSIRYLIIPVPVAILTIVLATDVPEDFGSTTQKLLSRGIAFMRIIF
jgi:hypothetical protein